MQHEPRTKHELRCFCSRKPLLAMYGLDTRRQIYVHVKVFKGGRVFGEMLVTSGTVHLRCRECLRWQRVIIKEPGIAALRTEPKPQVLHHEPPSAGSLPPSQPTS